MSHPVFATCTRCHQVKPLSQLNGYNPISKDTSRVYCKRLIDCQSHTANKTLSTLVGCVSRTNTKAKADTQTQEA
ncbi:hypothetical protein [Psychrobacter lutiphocae]|uniref:hypothetical protein n=1 Tax=Psychrobacter lutiphocae TaxID=540500 RepID=UPI000381C42D|nr:hypothetical protein [Psychrobacter lutiphocae]